MEATPPQKNKLMLLYEDAQVNYTGLLLEWKKEFLDKNELRIFLRTYAYANLDDIPYKFHKKFIILQTLIQNFKDKLENIKENIEHDFFTFQDAGY